MKLRTLASHYYFARNVFFWLLDLTGLSISIASAIAITLLICYDPLAFLSAPFLD